ncbi:MAG: prepilin-type N-terminal cleavage/methylation domain-containing protein [Sedimentisphaerales bacterium]|nr:prepilin-type N-terminal cleavage/methylation domain-containing protein [Sedimentisphaerales bacterium]
MRTTQDTRRRTQDAGRNEPRNRPVKFKEFPGLSPRNLFKIPEGGRFTSRKGMTLPEMTVVITIAALMVGLTVPAINMLLNSFESQSGAKSIINAALTSARTIAVKEQRYAGIRFQKRYDPNTSVLNAPQYMIFIIQDPAIMSYGFRAVDGIQPIKLPDSIGVMDLTIVPQRNIPYPDNPAQQVRIDDPVNGGDNTINDNFEFLDTTTFSIIFSPSGKLVIHGVRVRNKDGQTNDSSKDDIFNTANNVNNLISMFYQDDYWIAPYDYGFGPEPSRNSFVIYETKTLKQTDKNYRWSRYLNRLKIAYINSYTGTIVSQ